MTVWSHTIKWGRSRLLRRYIFSVVRDRSNPVSYNLERKCREACWRHFHSPSDSSTSSAVLGFFSPGIFFSNLKFRPSVVSHSQACGCSRRWAVTHSWLTWPALLSFQWIKQMNETIQSTFCKVKLMKGE